MSEFKRGTQVMYIGGGADDFEYGFVTSLNPDETLAFVRYWKKKGPGLRTTANSEGTYLKDLKVYRSVADWEVEAYLKAIEENSHG